MLYIIFPIQYRQIITLKMEQQRIKQLCHQIKACKSLEEAKQLAVNCLNKELGPKPIGIAQPVRKIEPTPSVSSSVSEAHSPIPSISGSESDSSDGYMIDVHFGDTPPPVRRRRIG